jgi:signal transduction histidine kinase
VRTVAFAQAAHEFRNPLSGMNSALDLLEPSVNKKTGDKYFKIAKNCSNLMMFLANDILDFSQCEAQ